MSEEEFEALLDVVRTLIEIETIKTSELSEVIHLKFKAFERQKQHFLDIFVFEDE